MKKIKIRASLIRASKDDCFCRSETPKENKMFFIRNAFGEFTGTYKIMGNDRFDIQEILNALHSNSLYTLTSVHCSTNFSFKLILQQAEDFDVLYTKNYAKPNTIYYVRNSHEEVSGPHHLKESSDVNRISEAIKKGIIYIPSNNQTFEKL